MSKITGQSTKNAVAMVNQIKDSIDNGTIEPTGEVLVGLASVYAQLAVVEALTVHGEIMLDQSRILGVMAQMGMGKRD